MTASSDDTSSASRSDRRRSASARNSHYMIAPAGLGETRQTLIDRLNRVADVEIVQTYAERGIISPPMAMVRTSDENAAALRRSTGGELVIEPDRYLRAASFMGSSQPSQMIAAMNALGPGFAVTIRALSENGEPLEHAEVQLVGEQGAARGLTDRDGKVDLTLYGELPETVTELFVRARSGYWGLWRHRPNLQADAVNTFTLEPLSLPKLLDWGGKAMRFDQLPTECRGPKSRSPSSIPASPSATNYWQGLITASISGLAVKDDPGRRMSWATVRHARASSAPFQTRPMAYAAMHRKANCTFASFLPTRVAATSWRRSTIASRPASTLRAWGSDASGVRPSSSSGSLRQNSKASASSPRPATPPERCCSPPALRTCWLLE